MVDSRYSRSKPRDWSSKPTIRAIAFIGPGQTFYSLGLVGWLGPSPTGNGKVRRWAYQMVEIVKQVMDHVPNYVVQELFPSLRYRIFIYVFPIFYCSFCNFVWRKRKLPKRYGSQNIDQTMVLSPRIPHTEPCSSCYDHTTSDEKSMTI